MSAISAAIAAAGVVNFIKALVREELGQEARLYFPSTRRRAVPDGLSTLTIAAASCYCPLDRQGDWIERWPTSPRFLNGMGTQNAALEYHDVLAFKGFAREGPEAVPLNGSSILPTTSSKSRTWHGGSRPMRYPVRRRMDEKHIFPADTDPGRGWSSASRPIYVSEESGGSRPRPARGGADHGSDGVRLSVDQLVHFDPQHAEWNSTSARAAVKPNTCRRWSGWSGSASYCLTEPTSGSDARRSRPKRRSTVNQLTLFRSKAFPAAARTKSTMARTGEHDGPRVSPRGD